ncbi:MAG: flippase [Alphaproteobacteria bacterium]|nr:flippase [Alphaproteobacteria bacterium]
MPFHELSVKIKDITKAHQNLSKAVVNTCWLAFEKVVRLSLGITVGAWMARYLGPDKFGTYSYIIALFTLFYGFSRLGLDNILIRDLVKNSKDKNELLGSAFLLKVFSGFVSIGLMVLTVDYLRPDEPYVKLMALIVSLGFVLQAFSVIEFWFSSQVKAKYTVFAKMFAFVVASIATVVLILMNAPLISFVKVYLFEIALISVGSVCVYCLKEQSITKWKARYSIAKELLAESWPLLLSAIAVTVYLKVDTLMIANMVGDKETGIYNAAVRVSEVWYFIPMAIVSSITPLLIKSKERSKSLFMNRLGMLFNVLSALTILVSLLVTFFSEDIIRILFGEEYQRSASILSVHVWASVFVALGVAQSVWIVNEGYTKFALFRTSLGMLANIMLNIFLIPIHGAMGAAIATIISYAVSGLVSNVFYNRDTRDVFLLQLKSLFLYDLKGISSCIADNK